MFDGTIHTARDGTFYVERAQRYLQPGQLGNSSAHSVIYHHDHLNLPWDKSWQVLCHS